MTPILLALATQLIVSPFPMPCDFKDALPPLCPAEYTATPGKPVVVSPLHKPFPGWLAPGWQFGDEGKPK